MEDLLRGLNPEQHEAVVHKDGPVLVASGAGSGKTTVVVRRVGYLTTVHGVDPRRVLAVTFNKKAADEMNERLNKLIGRRAGARIGTFHSVAYEIARSERPELRDWEIDDKDLYRRVIKDAVGFQGMNWDKADISFLEEFFSFAKGELALPGSDRVRELAEQVYRQTRDLAAVPEKVLMAFFNVEEMRKERRILTFDDMLVEACTQLADENTRSRWASRFDYLIQDEAQDQNHAQMVMAEAFARDHRNYMLVGDPAQAIYSWRGAQPQKLVSFPEDWDARVIHMGRNYRSGRTIIEAANRSLRAMPANTRLDMELIAERDLDGMIEPTLYVDFDDEGQEVASHILQLHEDGVKWGDIAVLYRTNAQSRGPEESLISMRVPYRVEGGANFYDRKEVKDLLAYLRAATSGRYAEVSRAINSPFRYLGKAFLARVEAAVGEAPDPTAIHWPTLMRDVAGQEKLQGRQRDAAMAWAGLIDRVQGEIEGRDPTKPPTPPADLLESILTETKYTEWLVKSEGQESTQNNRVSNVRELVRAARRFTTTAELLDYIDKTIQHAQRTQKNPKPDTVTLTTVHRSKGREWGAVFLIGLNEGVLPHARGDMTEERRLFYVGVTRAKDRLFPSCVQYAATAKGPMPISPSTFLREVGIRPVPRERIAVKTLGPPVQLDPINEDIPW